LEKDELAALGRVDGEHWYYRGKRAIVARWVAGLSAQGEPTRVLDIGVGTGRMSGVVKAGRVFGLDISREALTLARDRMQGRLVQGDVTRLPMRDSSFSAVTALDVLEHLADDARGLAEMLRVVQGDGFVVLTVPAFPFLWSDWDRALGHYRRYTRTSLDETVRQAQGDVCELRYLNYLGFAGAVVWRQWRKRAAKGSRGARIEDWVPPRWLNAMLYRAMVWPSLAHGLSLPFGLSLLAVVRPREGARANPH